MCKASTSDFSDSKNSSWTLLSHVSIKLNLTSLFHKLDVTSIADCLSAPKVGFACRVQILAEAAGFTFAKNNLRKDIGPFLLSQLWFKYQGRLCCFRWRET